MKTIGLKPIDEPWMLRALLYIARYERDNGTGPTWREIAGHMHWKPKSFVMSVKMGKLRVRGLAWSDGVERSTRLTDAGLVHLHVTLRTATPPRANRVGMAR